MRQKQSEFPRRSYLFLGSSKVTSAHHRQIEDVFCFDGMAVVTDSFFMLCVRPEGGSEKRTEEVKVVDYPPEIQEYITGDAGEVLIDLNTAR